MRILSNLSRGLLNRKRHLLRSHWLSTAREGQVLLVYKEMVSSGALEFNEDQYKVLLRLSRLSNYLEGASPREFHEESVMGSKGDAENATKRDALANDTLRKNEAKNSVGPIVKGVYIHGGVGVGKTLAMDLFFENCKLDASMKRRVHLHNFLLEIHARIHDFKQQLLKERGRDVHIDLDPSRDAIAVVAKAVSRETWLLAFDEFEVTNVADAMILSKFFRTLWEHGTVVVATSNRHPSELYKHGLNRAYFLPFIDLLQSYNITRLIRGEDYRGKMTSLGESNFTSREALWARFVAAGGNCGEGMVAATQVPIKNSDTRFLSVPYCFFGDNGNVAWFSFAQLCEEGEKGASDFQALVDAFATVCVHDIPQLSLLKHNEARRFIVLIDILYDSHTRLLWSSSHDILDLFLDLTVDDEVEEPNRPQSQWVTPSFKLAPHDKDRNEDSEGRVASHKRSAEMLEKSLKLSSSGGKQRERRSPSDSCVYENVHLDAGEEDLRLLEGEVASVKELLFAFKRAASRLNEMRGSQYLEAWRDKHKA